MTMTMTMTVLIFFWRVQVVGLLATLHGGAALRQFQVDHVVAALDPTGTDSIVRPIQTLGPARVE